MTKAVYDVRARYDGDMTWVVRCTTLPELLWFLWRALTGRLRMHPDWPDEVLRYEIVRSPATHVQGWDPLRRSFRLDLDADAAVMLEQERMHRALEGLMAADRLDQAEERVGDYMINGGPDLPPFQEGYDN